MSTRSFESASQSSYDARHPHITNVHSGVLTSPFSISQQELADDIKGRHDDYHDEEGKATSAADPIGSIPGSWVESSTDINRRELAEIHDEDLRPQDLYKWRNDSTQNKALGRHLNPRETGSGKGIGVEGMGIDYSDDIRTRMEQMYNAVVELTEQNTMLASKLKWANQGSITWQAKTLEDSDGKVSYVEKKTQTIAVPEMLKTTADGEAQRLKDANNKLDMKLAEMERNWELVMRVLVVVVAGIFLVTGVALGR